MNISEGSVFKLFTEDELQRISPAIEYLYALGSSWMDYKTRTANRKCTSFNPTNIPEEYKKVKQIR